jgi:hypothetical protein
MEAADALKGEHGEGLGGIRAAKQDPFLPGATAGCCASFHGGFWAVRERALCCLPMALMLPIVYRRVLDAVETARGLTYRRCHRGREG